QEMARVFGLEALRMADTDVLPYDYVTYAREVGIYLASAHKKANEYELVALDFTPAELAATHLANAGQRARGVQLVPPANPVKLNTALRGAEAALLSPDGL